jgi:hypothetical protein
MDPQSGGRLTFQIGNACGSMTGIIYAPKQEFYMNDSGGDAKCGGLNLTTDLVVGTLFDKTATLTITPFSATHPTLTPLLVVSLVE